MPNRFCVAVVALSVAYGCSVKQRSTQGQSVSGSGYPFKRMSSGQDWLTGNVNLASVPSHCYDDAESHCRQYGRLYTWRSAQEACQALGDRWRLPTAQEWRELAKPYGGVSDDSDDRGKGAYAALLMGGRAGFDALLGGGRAPDGQYGRLDAHGFYWTASESSATNAWFFNFGKGGLALHIQRDGEKEWAFSVRCVRG